MKGQWKLVPVIDELTASNVWEHAPLDYYRYGEYPRFIRPVGAHRHRTEWKWQPGTPWENDK